VIIFIFDSDPTHDVVVADDDVLQADFVAEQFARLFHL
jgi:hypothetical protein